MRLVSFWCGDPPHSLIDTGRELIILPPVDSAVKATIAKDNALFDCAVKPEYADAVFVDHDCTLIDDIPHSLNPQCGYFRGRPDTFLVAVNGRHEAFDYVLWQKRNRKIQDRYAWPRLIMMEVPFDKIPDRCYNHAMVTFKSQKEI